jgi:hypothetical protein
LYSLYAQHLPAPAPTQSRALAFLLTYCYQCNLFI